MSEVGGAEVPRGSVLCRHFAGTQKHRGHPIHTNTYTSNSKKWTTFLANFVVARCVSGVSALCWRLAASLLWWWSHNLQKENNKPTTCPTDDDEKEHSHYKMTEDRTTATVTTLRENLAEEITLNDHDQNSTPYSFGEAERDGIFQDNVRMTEERSRSFCRRRVEPSSSSPSTANVDTSRCQEPYHDIVFIPKSSSLITLQHHGQELWRHRQVTRSFVHDGSFFFVPSQRGTLTPSR